MCEKWRYIQGYEGLYEVSNLGRVKSLKRIDSSGRTVKEKILKLKKEKNGYSRVLLSKNGKSDMFLVHRLVALAFIQNVNSYPIINHKDEDKTNNTAENLEWCTYKYNNNYGTRLEKFANSVKGKHHTEETKLKLSEAMRGNKNPRAKKVICTTTGEIFSTTKEASLDMKINSSSIVKCCKGKRQSAGKHPITGEKLIWMYVEQGANGQVKLDEMECATNE